MRRLVMWNLVTLDGYFEGPESWTIDWVEEVWGDELERFSLEQAREIGALLFGRVTYEGMAAHWPSAKGEIADFMNAVPKVVVSRTLERADWHNTSLVREDAVGEVARLKQETGKDLYVFGSADLSASLIGADLFDEYRLGLVPILLGAGNPLFKPGGGRRRLQLLEARALGRGCVLLRYTPDRGR